MKKLNNIAILSSFATDNLYNENGEFLGAQEGGPAYYITQALKEANADFSLEYSFNLNTEILVKSNDEFGKISTIPVPLKINYSKIKSPFLIISSLLNEFSLDGISRYKGQVFLDIQGYVRDGQDFGKKKNWQPPEEVQKSIFCLKTGDYETSYLPKFFLENQKNKLLLITKGKEGCDLFVDGKKYSIKPKKTVKVKNTLGAGDTFFASFIYEYIKTNNPQKSAVSATDRAMKFLAHKNIISTDAVESRALKQSI